MLFKERTPKITLLISTVVFLVPYLIPSHVVADGVGISVYPQVLEVHITSGSSLQHVFMVTNTSNTSEHLLISVAPFKDDNTGTGHVSYALAPNTALTQLLEQEVTFRDGDRPIKTLDLAPGESKGINLSINIPEGISEQDQYFSVICTVLVTENPTSTVKGTKDASSHVEVSTGMHVLLAINDTGTTNGALQDFTVPAFQTSGPVLIHISVSNQATHFMSINGAVHIRNLFGSEIQTIQLAPIIVLARTSRELEAKYKYQSASKGIADSIIWNPRFLFGRYTVTTTLYIPNTKSVITETKTIIGFPVPFILTLAFLVGVFIFIKKRMKHFSQIQN